MTATIAAAAALRSALVAAALCLAATAAQASEASDVAGRGGFLLGHAYRCGVPVDQLQSSAEVVHKLSSALAADESDKSDADKAFAERFVVSAAADSLGELLPACPVIKRALAEFEKHNPEAGSSGSSTPPAAAPASAGASEPTAAKPSHTRGARATRSIAGSQKHRRPAT